LPAITQLIDPTLWYSSTTTSVPFQFGQGAAQLPLIPGPGTNPFPGNEPLYDTVVTVVCRTCHVATPTSSDYSWNSFSQMNSLASTIQFFACGPATQSFPMPHSEVSWLRYWQQNLDATLASELSFASPGCPPPP
jgi:hypothetical protein